MVKTITGIVIAGISTICYGQVLIPGSSGYTHSATGQFYPQVGPNTILDPRTGQTYSIPSAPPEFSSPPDPPRTRYRDEDRYARQQQSAPQSPPQPVVLTCAQARHLANRLSNRMAAMWASDPQYEPLYYQKQELDYLLENQCQ